MSIKCDTNSKIITASLTAEVNELLENKRLEIIQLAADFQAGNHTSREDARMYERLLWSGNTTVLSIVEALGSGILKFTDSKTMCPALLSYIPFKPWPSALITDAGTSNYLKNMLDDFTKTAQEVIKDSYTNWSVLEANSEEAFTRVLMERMLTNMVQKIAKQLGQDWANEKAYEQLERLQGDIKSVFAQKAYLFQAVMPKQVEQVFEAMTFISAFLWLTRNQVRKLSEKNGFVQTIEPLLIFLLNFYVSACAQSSTADIKTRFNDFVNLAKNRVFQDGQLSFNTALIVIWDQKKSPHYLEDVLRYFLNCPQFGSKMISEILEQIEKNTESDIEYLKKQKNIPACLALWITKNGALHENPFYKKQ